MMRAMILDSYDWFVGLVDERRPLSRAEVVALADGSVFTGRQALQRKLVDSLGGELEAVKWLESKGVAPKLEVVEWEPERRGSSFLFGKAMARLGSLFGIGASDGNILSEIGADRIFLDGLVSVWQPDTSSSHAK